MYIMYMMKQFSHVLSPMVYLARVEVSAACNRWHALKFVVCCSREVCNGSRGKRVFVGPESFPQAPHSFSAYTTVKIGKFQTKSFGSLLLYIIFNEKRVSTSCVVSSHPSHFPQFFRFWILFFPLLFLTEVFLYSCIWENVFIFSSLPPFLF